jgi:hypothetical protein
MCVCITVTGWVQPKLSRALWWCVPADLENKFGRGGAMLADVAPSCPSTPHQKVTHRTNKGRVCGKRKQNARMHPPHFFDWLTDKGRSLRCGAWPFPPFA